MNTIDITILIILAFFAIKGLFRGIVIEVLTLVGLVLGYIFALKEMSRLTAIVQDLIALPPMPASILSFAAVFLAIVVLFRILAGLLHKLIHWSLLGWLDQGGGFVIGIFKGTLVASILTLFLSLTPLPEEMVAETNNSLLYQPIRKVAPAVFNALGKIFPKTHSFVDEIREGLTEGIEPSESPLWDNRLDSLQTELETRRREHPH